MNYHTQMMLLSCSSDSARLMMQAELEKLSVRKMMSWYVSGNKSGAQLTKVTRTRLSDAKVRLVLSPKLYRIVLIPIEGLLSTQQKSY